jgi:hypothetical protein
MTTKKAVKSADHGDAGRRPEVIVEFLFDRGRLFISVNNIGERAAVNVSVKFDKKIVGLGGTKEISTLPLFRNLQFLGPKREIVTFLDTSGSYFKRKQPMKITARVSYQDADAQKYDETMSHNLEVYREVVYLNPSSLNDADTCPKLEV